MSRFRTYLSAWQYLWNISVLFCRELHESASVENTPVFSSSPSHTLFCSNKLMAGGFEHVSSIFGACSWASGTEKEGLGTCLISPKVNPLLAETQCLGCSLFRAASAIPSPSLLHHPVHLCSSFTWPDSGLPPVPVPERVHKVWLHDRIVPQVGRDP